MKDLRSLLRIPPPGRTLGKITGARRDVEYCTDYTLELYGQQLKEESSWKGDVAQ